jgi:alpha-galactosidase/6-phospho-beta-glucosidase family protein
MADARNKKAGHSGSERIDREEAMKHADFVIEWIQIFKGWY